MIGTTERRGGALTPPGMVNHQERMIDMNDSTKSPTDTHRSALRRFCERTKRPGNEHDCWQWTGALDKDGYGRLWVDGRDIGAHRFAYENLVASIPVGLMVCHTCDNPRCCNPGHLFLGTALDNNHDRNQKGRANVAVGERARSARLTADDVLEIRRLYRPGDPNFNQPALALRYGLCQQTISDIVNRRRWKHLPIEGGDE